MIYAKKLYSLFMVITAFALVLSACATGSTSDGTGSVPKQEDLPNTGADSGTTAPSIEVSTYNDFVTALTAAGVEVTPGEKVASDVFNVDAQIVEIFGSDVQVYEFPDEAARQAVSDQISPDGSSVATSMIEWVDQPNFWAKGRIIVLYVGTDANTIDLITSVMGAPITVPD